MFVEYKSNIPVKIVGLSQLKNLIGEHRRRGLRATAFYFARNTSDFIKNEGNGNWPDRHPLTKTFVIRDGAWRRRNTKFKDLFRLGSAVRFRITRKETQAEIGFGGTPNFGETKYFSRLLQKRAYYAQTGYQIPIDETRRKMFGATRRSSDDTSGKDFFPIRKETTQLNVPARPIMEPVFQIYAGPVFLTFEKRFSSKISKEFERL